MSRTEAKQRVPHILMDTDFYEKPENIEALDHFGEDGPACIQRLCSKLINENSGKILKTQALSMWRVTRIKKAKWAKIIEFYIKCGWLIEEGEYLSSVRVGNERARVLQKRSILSANAKQKHNKSEAKIEQSESKSPDTDTVTDNNNKEVPIGLVKVGVHTYLSEISKDQIKARFASEGLNGKDIKRAIEYLDKDFEVNSHKRYPIRDHRLDLIGWPLDKVRQFNAEMDKKKTTEKPKPASVSYSESPHPAVRAQRERDAREALEKLGMGGLAK